MQTITLTGFGKGRLKWSKTYKDLYKKVKTIVKRDACIKVYDAARPLYLETDVSRIHLGARLLEVRGQMNYGHDEIPDNVMLWPIPFASKIISSAEWQYSDIECKASGILHWLEKFHHYCFMRELCIITDHKPLVAILSKDVAMLPQQLQCILLWIHQYRMCIIYKPCADLYIMDWLSNNNHKKVKIEWMRMSMNAISMFVNVPVCSSIKDIQTVTCDSVHLQEPRVYIIQRWPYKKEEVVQGVRQN